MQVGLGVQPVSIRQAEYPRPLSPALAIQLDLALNGRGWFQVLGPNNQTLYLTGPLSGKNAQGQLVTQDGYQVVPNITLPANTVSVQVISDGTVYVDTGDWSYAAGRPDHDRKFPERSWLC